MKIEAGQKWRYVGTSPRFFTTGKIYTVLTSENQRGSFTIEDDQHAETGVNHSWTNDSEFHAVFERAEGPVRTVTRKEIVSGYFGRLRVNGVNGLKPNEVLLSLLDRNRQPIDGGNFSSAELRGIIATLTEIADALDEQS